MELEALRARVEWLVWPAVGPASKEVPRALKEAALAG
jgi:hypothetical protein